MTPVSVQITRTSPYAVPADKNLRFYAFQSRASAFVQIDGNGAGELASDGNQQLGPYTVAPGTVLSAYGDGAWLLNGELEDVVVA